MSSYPRAIFTVTDECELRALLREAGLATLITHSADGLAATHIPLVYDEAANMLRGHMSRTNPQSTSGATKGFALFHTMDAYVTPSWYPSKQRHGRVAPTWNYEFLHVHGDLRWIEDANWLLRNVEEITDRHEARQPHPWKVSDAPDDFTSKLIPAIIGLELCITKVECRRKLSQNSNNADRNGAMAGLSASDNLADRIVGEAMLRLANARPATE